MLRCSNEVLQLVNLILFRVQPSLQGLQELGQIRSVVAVDILAQVVLLSVVSVVRHAASRFAPFHLEVLVSF